MAVRHVRTTPHSWHHITDNDDQPPTTADPDAARRRAGGHPGAPPPWCAGHGGDERPRCPSRHQPHERLASARHRRPIRPGPGGGVVVVLPLGDQRLPMRIQRRIEFGRIHVGEFDLPAGELLVDRFGERGLRLWWWIRVGVGSGFQLDRGAQLADGGHLGQLRIMRACQIPPRPGRRSPRPDPATAGPPAGPPRSAETAPAERRWWRDGVRGG